MARRVLVLMAHPDLGHSRVHRALHAGLRRAKLPEGLALEIRDLYADYPDYVIDVEREQQAAARADLIVWQHPIHWYGMPPLMKLWLDEVLTHGWGWGEGAIALRGRALWLVASTGGGPEAYRPEGHHHHGFEAFLPPYLQTAQLCGLQWRPPWILHGVQHDAPAQLEARGDEYVARLIDEVREAAR